MPPRNDFRALMTVTGDFAIRLFDQDNGLESVTHRRYFSAPSSAGFALALSTPLAAAASLGFVVPGAGNVLIIIFLFALLAAPFVLVSRTPPRWRGGLLRGALVGVVAATMTTAALVAADLTYEAVVAPTVVAASVAFCATFSHYVTSRTTPQTG